MRRAQLHPPGSYTNIRGRRATKRRRVRIFREVLRQITGSGLTVTGRLFGPEPSAHGQRSTFERIPRMTSSSNSGKQLGMMACTFVCQILATVTFAQQPEPKAVRFDAGAISGL